MGFFSNLTSGHWENTYGSGVGDFLNNITGATSSAKRQNKYQKEFAQNAHQWEVQDLEKAGINPILASGSGGATAGGAGGTTGSAGISPIAEAVNVITGITSAAKQNKETKLIEEQVNKTGAEIENIRSDTKNRNADTDLKIVQKQQADLDYAIKSGAKQETIDNLKAQVHETWARIRKTMSEEELLEEQRKRIMGGWVAEKLGTGALDAMSEADKSAKRRAQIYKNKHNAGSKETEGYAKYGTFKGFYGLDPTKIMQ